MVIKNGSVLDKTIKVYIIIKEAKCLAGSHIFPNYGGIPAVTKRMECCPDSEMSHAYIEFYKQGASAESCSLFYVCFFTEEDILGKHRLACLFRFGKICNENKECGTAIGKGGLDRKRFIDGEKFT